MLSFRVVPWCIVDIIKDIKLILVNYKFIELVWISRLCIILFMNVLSGLLKI